MPRKIIKFGVTFARSSIPLDAFDNSVTTLRFPVSPQCRPANHESLLLSASTAVAGVGVYGRIF